MFFGGAKFVIPLSACSVGRSDLRIRILKVGIFISLYEKFVFVLEVRRVYLAHSQKANHLSCMVYRE